jgi:5-methylcytosine-specific restriction endonuclease McrA
LFTCVYSLYCRSRSHIEGIGNYGGETSWDRTAAEIRDRDQFSCVACSQEYGDGAAFPVHHMIPRSEGGPDEEWNLCPLCPSCHPSVDAQPEFAKIPTDKEGNSYVDRDELMNRWHNYRFGEPT